MTTEQTLATLETTAAEYEARRQALSARLAEVERELAAVSPDMPARDFTRVAALRVERDAIVEALESIAEVQQELQGRLRPMLEQRRWLVQRTDEARALLAGLPQAFQDPIAWAAHPPFGALQLSPLQAFHRLAMSAADLLREQGEEVPDAITIVMPLHPITRPAPYDPVSTLNAPPAPDDAPAEDDEDLDAAA